MSILTFVLKLYFATDIEHVWCLPPHQLHDLQKRHVTSSSTKEHDKNGKWNAKLPREKWAGPLAARTELKLAKKTGMPNNGCPSLRISSVLRARYTCHSQQLLSGLSGSKENRILELLLRAEILSVLYHRKSEAGAKCKLSRSGNVPFVDCLILTLFGYHLKFSGNLVFVVEFWTHLRSLLVDDMLLKLSMTFLIKLEKSRILVFINASELSSSFSGGRCRWRKHDSLALFYCNHWQKHAPKQNFSIKSVAHKNRCGYQFCRVCGKTTRFFCSKVEVCVFGPPVVLRAMRPPPHHVESATPYWTCHPPLTCHPPPTRQCMVVVGQRSTLAFEAKSLYVFLGWWRRLYRVVGEWG